MANQDDSFQKDSSTQTTSLRSRFHYSFPLKLVLSFLLLWALYQLNLLQVAPLVSLAKTPWLLAGLIFLAWSTFPICALRWWQLLHIQGVKSTLFEVFKVVYSSTFLGLLLPGAVGTDVVRLAFGFNMARHQISLMTLSVVVDRLLGMLGLLALGLLASLVYLDRFLSHPRLRNLVLLLTGIFLAGLLAGILVGVFARHLSEVCRQKKWEVNGFIRQFAAKIIESVALYSDRPGQLALGLGLSILVNGKNLLMLAILAKAMGIGGMGPWQYAIVGTVSFLVSSLPLTPGGLGVGETAFSQMALWLEPTATSPAYATVLLAFRAVTAFALLPAILLSNPIRRLS